MTDIIGLNGVTQHAEGVQRTPIHFDVAMISQASAGSIGMIYLSAREMTCTEHLVFSFLVESVASIWGEQKTHVQMLPRTNYSESLPQTCEMG